MTEAVEPDDAALGLDSLAWALEILIGMLRPEAAPGLAAERAKLERWLRAEATRIGEAPPTREWQLVRRVAHLLGGGEASDADALLAEVSDPESLFRPE